MVNNQLPERLLVSAVCGLLLLAVALVFGQTVQHEFVNYDDDGGVYQNPHVTGGLSARNAAWAFTRTRIDSWIPLTWLSRMLDCQIYGLWAGGHHLTNVLLHAAAAILLFLALRRMTGRLWPCAFVAALFAIHPLRVESVAWVTERKDVLSGLFFMLTLLAYADYARRPFALGRYLAVLVLFALGLMSKPMLVTLPCVLLLLDYWPLGRLNSGMTRKRVLLEKVPLFLLAMAGVLAVWVAEDTTPLTILPLASRINNALVSYANYIAQLVYPVGLAPFYPHPRNSLPMWKVGGAAVLLAGLTLWAVASRRRMPWLLVGWLWYLGTLLPVIGLIQAGSQAMADRYTYLPHIGLYMALAWGALYIAGTSTVRRRLCGVAALCALVVVGWLAWQQTSYWKNSETLWNHTLSCTSRNYLAHNNLGETLAGQGRADDAIRHYREALRLDPRYVLAHNNLGVALASQGKGDDAIRHYQEALRLDPGFASAHNNLGAALAKQGKTAEAILQYREALRLDPGYAASHNNLGETLAGQGKADDAILQYREALRLDPGYAAAHHNLGAALASQGKADDAIRHYREALRLDPELAEARYNWGSLLLDQGKFDEAIRQYQEVLRINPAYSKAHNNLGIALLRQGKVADATRHFQETLRLDPGHVKARYNLGGLLLEQCMFDDAIDHCREALRIDPRYASAVNLLCEALQRKAEAQAAAGRFPEAATSAREAAGLAAAQGDKEMAERIGQRIEAYQAGQPYREAGPRRRTDPVR